MTETDRQRRPNRIKRLIQIKDIERVSSIVVFKFDNHQLSMSTDLTQGGLNCVWEKANKTSDQRFRSRREGFP